MNKGLESLVEFYIFKKMEDEAQSESRAQMLTYFQRVETMLNDPTFGADIEDADLFITNVMEEIKGKGFRLACDMHCSRVLERLISVRIIPLF